MNAQLENETKNQMAILKVQREQEEKASAIKKKVHDAIQKKKDAEDEAKADEQREAREAREQQVKADQDERER